MIDMRIEIRVPFERALLPPLWRLANRHDDRVLGEAARSPLRRALVRVIHHLRARVTRIAKRAFERDDLRRLTDTAAQLLVDLLETRPVLARDLHHVARFVEAGALAGGFGR